LPIAKGTIPQAENQALPLARLTQLGQRLFTWLDGNKGWLRQALSQSNHATLDLNLALLILGMKIGRDDLELRSRSSLFSNAAFIMR